MKILIMGDFHGRFPDKLKKEAKKADIVLSPGDFPDSDKIRKLVFKNWNKKKWYEAVSSERAEKLEKESFNSGLKILKEINKLKKDFYFVWGNADYYKEFNISKHEEIIPDYYDNRIKKLKYLHQVQRKRARDKEIEILGHGGYVDVTEYIKNPIDDDIEGRERRLKRYKDTRKILLKLFKKKPGDFIFITHYTPYKCLDRVNMKGNPMYGKNVGFEPYNQIIKKYKPILVVCGHMHENQGFKKIGKTVVINPGSAREGKAAVIEIENRKVKNMMFIR